MSTPRGNPPPQEGSLTPYAGRWIARLRGRIVGIGGTPEQALRTAKASRPKEEPEISFVPRPSPLTFSSLLEQLVPHFPSELRVYLVGGAVRDALLGLETHDLDFAVQGDALRLARRVADALGGAYYPLDDQHGTGRVVLVQPSGERMMLDFATLQGNSLEEDLRARDFTVNALAVDVRQPQSLLDPMSGAADLHAKRLRACTPSSLQDDPVRILRALRLATTYKLQITPDTRRWMREALPLLGRVSPERLRDELMRILGGSHPGAALRAMDIMGVFPHLLPELPALKGVTQSPPHIYDVWQHTIQTVDRLEKVLAVLGEPSYDPDQASNLAIGLAVLRLGRFRQQINTHLQAVLVPGRPWRGLLFFAALYHDVGKPETRKVDDDGRIRFFGHDRLGAELLGTRARALHFSNQEIKRLKSVVRHHMRPHLLVSSGQPPSRRAVYRFFRDTREAGVDICLLTLADVLATAGPSLSQFTWAAYLDILRRLLEAWWESPQKSVSPPPLVSGRDLIEKLGLSPGPEIGQLLELIREAQVAGEVTTADQALELAGRHTRLPST